MYGGSDGDAAIVGLYSPINVSPMVTSSHPGGRSGQAMAYDSVRLNQQQMGKSNGLQVLVGNL